MKFDPSQIRGEFPALSSGAVFFDNPGGTQVHQNVIDEMTEYLAHYNANRGGAFLTSQRSDEVLHETRNLAATFLNASEASEVVFGPNMTTLTFALSHALALEFQPGDELIVTRLDHDANISPWLRLADDRNCKVHWCDFDIEDGTLQIEQLQGLIYRPHAFDRRRVRFECTGDDEPGRQGRGTRACRWCVVFYRCRPVCPAWANRRPAGWTATS